MQFMPTLMAKTGYIIFFIGIILWIFGGSRDIVIISGIKFHTVFLFAGMVILIYAKIINRSRVQQK